LSRRYYNHYLNIINTPEPQPQSSAVPAQEESPPPVDTADSGKDEPATDQVIGMKNENGQAETSLGLADDLAGIAEVTPIRLTSPGPHQTSYEGAGKPASEKGAKKGWCFIATAAFGSPLAREVVLLQGFRDNCLSRHALGEKFIRAYYRFSPPLAEQISRHKLLKRMTRLLLFPIILVMKRSSRSPGPS
jgi:hypothetical protein